MGGMVSIVSYSRPGRGLLCDCKTLRNLHEGSFEALMNTGHVIRKSDSKIRNCLMGFNDT